MLPAHYNLVQQDLHYGLCKMQTADYRLQTDCRLQTADFSRIYRVAISIINTVADSKQANLGVILAYGGDGGGQGGVCHPVRLIQVSLNNAE